MNNPFILLTSDSSKRKTLINMLHVSQIIERGHCRDLRLTDRQDNILVSETMFVINEQIKANCI